MFGWYMILRKKALKWKYLKAANIVCRSSNSLHLTLAKVTEASGQSVGRGPRTQAERGDGLGLELRIPALFLAQTVQLLREKQPDPDTFDGVCEH